MFKNHKKKEIEKKKKKHRENKTISFYASQECLLPIIPDKFENENTPLKGEGSGADGICPPSSTSPLIETRVLDVENATTALYIRDLSESDSISVTVPWSYLLEKECSLCEKYVACKEVYD